MSGNSTNSLNILKATQVSVRTSISIPHIRRLARAGEMQFRIGPLQTGQPHRRDPEGFVIGAPEKLRLHIDGLAFNHIARRHLDRLDGGAVQVLADLRTGAAVDIVIGEFRQTLLGGAMQVIDAGISVGLTHGRFLLGR